MSEIDYTSTNDPRVRVACGFDADRAEHTVRYTVFLKDRHNSGEEIDLDVVPRTPMSVVRSAARFVVRRDYEPGLTVGRVEERFGLYL